MAPLALAIVDNSMKRRPSLGRIDIQDGLYQIDRKFLRRMGQMGQIISQGGSSHGTIFVPWAF